MTTSISLESIRFAQQSIAPWVERTPLVHSKILSQLLQTNIYLKLDTLQPTGAFKVRGAFNKMLSLTPEEKSQGVIAVSAGNHGRAVAYAAQALGLKCRLFMPENTSKEAIHFAEHCGAEVTLFPTIAKAFEEAKKVEGQGVAYVHPYGDPLVITGQGTIGLELLEDLPELTDVVVSIGGGGLISGVATAIKSQKPSARVWGVQVEGADAMVRALEANRVIQLERITSIAKTLGASEVAEGNLRITQALVEKVLLVSNEEAFRALKYLLEEVKLLTEPAASCTLAAAQHLKSCWNKDHHVVLVLCGGNISLDEIAMLRARFFC